MMTSDRRAYVWIWLPGLTSPVAAGLIERNDQDRYRFTYGRRYLARPDAITLFPQLMGQAISESACAGGGY
ncbi:hypothetical protein [Halorhodospira abdelmalekii]|uniref:hypothetical protein n=1 Tax=Halorhodospira abdelmalekii TaxID=421629 RepID=UPI0019087F2E|nr:hypothetical protein [Halorhodospira abdelmalekii]